MALVASFSQKQMTNMHLTGIENSKLGNPHLISLLISGRYRRNRIQLSYNTGSKRPSVPDMPKCFVLQREAISLCVHI